MLKIIDKIYNEIVFDDQISSWILPFIESENFKRLKSINQLGLYGIDQLKKSYSRYEHSLGTCYVTSKIVETVSSTIIEKFGEKFYYKCLQYAVIASLLHDIGHGPFSHAFEYFFTGQNPNYPKIKHEDWGTLFINGYKNSFLEQYNRLNLNFPLSDADLSYVSLMMKGDLNHSSYDFLNTIIASEIDADRIDYVLRDAAFYDIKHNLKLSDLIGAFQLKFNVHKNEFFFYIKSSHKEKIKQFKELREHLFKKHYFSKTKLTLELNFSNFIKEKAIFVIENKHVSKDFFYFFALLKKYNSCGISRKEFIETTFPYYKNLSEKDFLTILSFKNHKDVQLNLIQ